ncbi:hypothetical protein V5799_034222 [Amblyomma americanum]|uniref:Histone H2A n=1 Tax=Amblyomma americanum TaxID=6943 RepID=A0AAQ4DL41_AMBAM
MAAVLKYLTAGVLEFAGKAARDNKTRVTPRHIQLAVRTDKELWKLLSGVTISEGCPTYRQSSSRRRPVAPDYAEREGAAAPVCMAAVLEYLAAEMLELTGKAARDNNKTLVTPRHIQLAVRTDKELRKLLSGVTISEGGVLPHIPTELLPKKPGGSGLRGAGGSRSPRLHGRGARVPHCGSAGARRQSGARQQQDSGHAASHPASRAHRQGAEEAALQCHHI